MAGSEDSSYFEATQATRLGPLLISGWNSYVGQAVLRAASALKIRTTLLVSHPDDVASVTATGHAYALADPTDPASIRRAVCGHEAVVHVIGIVDGCDLPRESRSTLNMISALDPGASFVMPGHSGVFAATTSPFRRPSEFAPPALLRHSAKIHSVIADAAQRGHRAFTCHAALVLGRESGTAIREWLRTSRQQGRVSGRPSRARWHCVTVDDFAGLLLAAAYKGAPGESPLFAGVEAIHVAQVAQFLAHYTGLPIDGELPVGTGTRWARLLVRDQVWKSDVETLALGWRPRSINLEQLIADACSVIQRGRAGGWPFSASGIDPV